MIQRSIIQLIIFRIHAQFHFAVCATSQLSNDHILIDGFVSLGVVR